MREGCWAAVGLRFFVIDIDGTLTDEGGALDLEAVKTIRMLRALGYEVLLASARSAWEAWTIAKAVQASPIVIAENGGVLAFSPKELVLLGDRALALRGLEVLEKEGLGPRVKETVPPLTCVILEPSLPSERARGALERSGLDVQLVETGFSVLLTKKGVDKARALGVLASMRPSFGPQGGVAVGDGDNDVPLFTLCGYSIAVANASPSAKRAAKYVAGHKYGAGLHEGVEALLRQGLLAPPAKG